MDFAALLFLACAGSLLTVLPAQVVSCSPPPDLDTAMPRVETTGGFGPDREAPAIEPDFLFATAHEWQAYARALEREAID